MRAIACAVMFSGMMIAEAIECLRKQEDTGESVGNFIAGVFLIVVLLTVFGL